VAARTGRAGGNGKITILY